MNFSINSSMVMGRTWVEGVRGTCVEKAETKTIQNPDPGLMDRLTPCSWQKTSNVTKPKNSTCTAARMIKRVVAFALANVQQTKALVLECCRVGWTHRLLIWRTVVITNTAGIKCRESFADGMVIASNICARVNIFETKYKITSYDRNLTNFSLNSYRNLPEARSA